MAAKKEPTLGLADVIKGQTILANRGTTAVTGPVLDVIGDPTFPAVVLGDRPGRRALPTVTLVNLGENKWTVELLS